MIVAMKQVEATQEFLQQFKSFVASCLLQKDADVNMSKFDPAIKLVYKELNC